MMAFRPRTFAVVTFDHDVKHASAVMWVGVVILALLMYSGERHWNVSPQSSGTLAFGTAGAQSKGGDSPLGLGSKIYHEKCAGCHGNRGEGAPNLFPPLAGDPVVNATDPGDHIRTVLFGRHGAIIGGVSYTVYMPSWAGQLSDREIAAVINHERTSWGNNAPVVTPAEVAKVRSQGPL
jgi:mono/diheme cytochrome c family protein